MTAITGACVAVLATDSSLARSRVPGGKVTSGSASRVFVRSAGLLETVRTNTSDAFSIASRSLRLVAVSAASPAPVGAPGEYAGGCQFSPELNGGIDPKVSPGLGEGVADSASLDEVVAVRATSSAVAKPASVDSAVGCAESVTGVTLVCRPDLGLPGWSLAAAILCPEFESDFCALISASRNITNAI